MCKIKYLSVSLSGIKVRLVPRGVINIEIDVERKCQCYFLMNSNELMFLI